MTAKMLIITYQIGTNFTTSRDMEANTCERWTNHGSYQMVMLAETKEGIYFAANEGRPDSYCALEALEPLISSEFCDS
jgi:hypothetical protein